MDAHSHTQGLSLRPSVLPKLSLCVCSSRNRVGRRRKRNEECVAFGVDLDPAVSGEGGSE
jgi:hypothetical protein